VTKFKVTMRDPQPDENGRKATAKEYVRAKDGIDATLEAMRRHPGWELLKLEEV
jgi:hypothetical protein